MKKVMFLLAVAGMFSFASCNNNKPAEEIVDTIAEEMVEETVDTTVAVEAVAEDAQEATQTVAE